MNTTLLILNPSNPTKVTQTGTGELLQALRERHIEYQMVPCIPNHIESGQRFVAIGLAQEYPVQMLLESNGKAVPRVPEALGCFRVHTRAFPALVLTGFDEAGLLYLLLDMARKIRLYGADAMEQAAETTEKPDNAVRCMDRYLLGHLDNEWFLSAEFWQYYFRRLAMARFNRFCLILGFDTAYMSPPYPFFLEVPGFEQVSLTARVRTPQRENLTALRMIVDLCHQYGMKFVLATWQQRPWTTAQESLVDRLPEAETELSAYCYQGMIALLKAIPDIDIVQFRVNHESGVGTQVSAEEFWNRCADAVAEAGRQLGKRFTLDLRAKGLTEAMVDHAQGLGLDVEVPTKYWCEHAALPYHLSVMRTEEQQQLDNYNHSRRYSYADMLQKPKKYDVIFRLWNYGSTNLFLWGDADYARRFAKSCSLSGAAGFQVNAPLALKYGHELSHQAPWKVFRDETLNQDRWEDERFWLWYTLYGRIGYNVNADSEIWTSEFTGRFGPETGRGLAHTLSLASRIVPLITTAHMPVHPSLRYWTELNTGWALFAENNLNEMQSFDFYDAITYGSTEPSDCGLFYGIDEFAHDVCAAGTVKGKYTPRQYAQWLEELAEAVLAGVGPLEQASAVPELRAACIDMRMTAYLGLYHAQKIRAAYALACWRETQNSSELVSCDRWLERAIRTWSTLSDLGDREYYHDLDFSSAGSKTRRGTWRDLMIELERDSKSVRDLLKEQTITPSAAVPSGEKPAAAPCGLTAEIPLHARGGCPIQIRAHATGIADFPADPVLHFRDVNQLRGNFQTITMERRGQTYAAEIPADQVDPAWDIMAYVTVQLPGCDCAMYPGIYHPKHPYPYVVIQTEE